MQRKIAILASAALALAAGGPIAANSANALPKQRGAYRCTCACVIEADNEAHSSGKIIDSAASCSTLNGKKCSVRTGKTKTGASITKTGKYDFCTNADGT